ncbi:MAG: Hsp20/alpha crystallin family protein [Deltaproteobacteria bacterium]|nr:Hsp20/alpha crystallin family protein [Deltaproteobacteria bacterium]
MSDQTLTPRDKQEVTDGEQVRPGRYYVPDVDIFEDADGLWVRADMPGVESDSVHVELHDGMLTVQGEVSLGAYSGLAPVYSEYRVGPFLRRFTLPERARFDADRIVATLVDGVLEVRVPRAEAAKPRRVPVASA